MAFQRAQYVIHNPILAQLHRRKVDGDTQGQILICPQLGLQAGLFQHPLANFYNGTVVFRDWNEVVRRHQAAYGVLPTQQCFCTDDPFRHKVYLWLVNQMKLVKGQSLRKILLKLFAIPDFLIDARHVKLEVVAAFLFGQHHGLFCAL